MLFPSFWCCCYDCFQSHINKNLQVMRGILLCLLCSLWQDEDLGSYFVQLLNTELASR